MKNFIKNITPPILYQWLRKLFLKPRIYTPRWNTLAYAPLKGIQMYFDPTGPWQSKIINNTYDSFLFKRISQLKMEGKIVYDIGAHIGFHSLYFARLVGPKGKVYAFEPNPKNIERLNLIREKNPDIKNIITVCDVAVSNVSGSETFSMSDEVESGRSSGSFIDTADTIWERSAFASRGFNEIQVKTVPMDLFKKELPIEDAPDVIKIDVEGAESLVLSGAKNTLLEKKPIIFLEVHSMQNMFDVVSFLTSLSYGLEIINKEQDGRCFIEARPKKL
jgi:FkbM family methyltransferase